MHTESHSAYDQKHIKHHPGSRTISVSLFGLVSETRIENFTHQIVSFANQFESHSDPVHLAKEISKKNSYPYAS